jgi:hypothetical protein
MSSFVNRLKTACSASLLLLAASTAPLHATNLTDGFANPPESTKPWCYWYWISDNISREGITRDLEAMARVGIGEAFIGNIFLDDVKPGPVKALTEEWWGMVEHAIREGGRVGVNIGMFNCPGWSQSGGPWIQSTQAMRYLASSETRVTGPMNFDQTLPQPADPFQDVAVLAFRAPEFDQEAVSTREAKISCSPATPDADRLVDGKLDAPVTFPAGAGQGNTPFLIDFDLSKPFTARSLSLHPGPGAWAAQCELQAAGDDGVFRSLRAFRFDRSNMEINVGPMPRGPVTVSFPPTTAKHFRLALSSVQGTASLTEVSLSRAARVESYVEKQLGKMHPTPLPMWDTYLWPSQSGPDTPSLAVPPTGVRNLTAQLLPGGRLQWEVPAGEWIILRTGMTPTGTRNAPASPEGRGLEVDKMNRTAAKAHFEAFIGQVLRRMPAANRKAFRHVVADSYEMGSQNWTDGFAAQFRQRYGYDSAPWLPTLTGRVVGNADLSDRFLWDLRRLVADRVATDYVGGLRDLCHPHGLQLWLENYGHWGFPAEFLQYGGQSDCVSGEYWVTGDLGSIECRAASSCGNTYGKPVVSGESFTGGPAFQTVPSSLKARGDWAFCEGINHFVLHVNILQPWEDKVPGVNAWFGTEFNRHNTWFEPGKAWIDYLRRSCFLLQQGNRVADVAYFIGEDTPKMTGIRQPELPPGCDFDYLNGEVLVDKLAVKNGVLTLPHGTTYRVLVLPDQTTMRPAVARKLRALVKAGATILGRPPLRSPSLEGYPKCDETVAAAARDLWGGTQVGAAGERTYGKGRVVWGSDLTGVLGSLGVGPDFVSQPKLRFTHRRTQAEDIYFVANPKAEPLTTTVGLRVKGKVPELWRPDTGVREPLVAYDRQGEYTHVPLNLGPSGSVFVVFRDRPGNEQRIVLATRNDEVLWDARSLPKTTPQSTVASATNNFTLACWVKPAADTTLVPEANDGVSGMSEPRNDVLFPPHGNTFSTDAGHAGCGLAVGRDGVCVFEHGGNYFAPVLVHPASLTDWTHVAVVYQDGRPMLYLNGKLARQGLQSRRTVHGVGAAANPQYRGKAGALELRPAKLTEAELGEWMKGTPQPGIGTTLPSLTLHRDSHGPVLADVAAPGTYRLQAAGDQVRTWMSLPCPHRSKSPATGKSLSLPAGARRRRWSFHNWRTGRNGPSLAFATTQARPSTARPSSCPPWPRMGTWAGDSGWTWVRCATSPPSA